MAAKWAAVAAEAMTAVLTRAEPVPDPGDAFYRYTVCARDKMMSGHLEAYALAVKQAIEAQDRLCREVLVVFKEHWQRNGSPAWGPAAAARIRTTVLQEYLRCNKAGPTPAHAISGWAVHTLASAIRMAERNYEETDPVPSIDGPDCDLAAWWDEAGVPTIMMSTQGGDPGEQERADDERLAAQEAQRADLRRENGPAEVTRSVVGSVVGDNNVVTGCSFGGGRLWPMPELRPSAAEGPRASNEFRGRGVVLAGVPNGSRVVSLVVELPDKSQEVVRFEDAEAALGRPLVIKATGTFTEVHLTMTTGSITLEGPVDRAVARTTSGKITVIGNAQHVNTTTGDVEVHGDCETARSTGGDIHIGRGKRAREPAAAEP